MYIRNEKEPFFTLQDLPKILHQNLQGVHGFEFRFIAMLSKNYKETVI